MVTYSSLPYDILHNICLASLGCRANGLSVLFNLSLTDHRTREVAIPILFKFISFRQTWLDTSKEQLDDLIDAVKQNDRILGVVKKVTLSCCIYQQAVEELPTKLGQLVFELPKLSTLRISLQFEKSAPFIDSLKKSGSGNTNPVMLPSVQDLTVPDEKWNFLIELCPNLQSLAWEAGGSRYISPLLPEIETLSKTHPRLKRLHWPKICEKKVLQELAEHLPLIEDLRFHGYTSGSILDHIPYLAGLKNLKRLSLPDIGDLNLGYRRPFCGTSLLRSPGLREKYNKEEREAYSSLIHAMDIYLTTHPSSSLQTISVGKFKRCHIYEVGEDRTLRRVPRSGGVDGM